MLFYKPAFPACRPSSHGNRSALWEFPRLSCLICLLPSCWGIMGLAVCVPKVVYHNKCVVWSVFNAWLWIGWTVFLNTSTMTFLLAVFGVFWSCGKRKNCTVLPVIPDALFTLPKGVTVFFCIAQVIKSAWTEILQKTFLLSISPTVIVVAHLYYICSNCPSLPCPLLHCYTLDIIFVYKISCFSCVLRLKVQNSWEKATVIFCCHW